MGHEKIFSYIRREYGSLDAIYVEGRDAWCPLYQGSGVRRYT